ncbi:hypothetical protein L3V83_02325 [Thiotrichales bacterium 19X7-9]|nr:hypothetical protein [Thiotrichales bacterium 19X7-9]
MEYINNNQIDLKQKALDNVTTKLIDILNNISDIFDFLTGFTYENFNNNEVTKKYINLSITINEAESKIKNILQQKHSSLKPIINSKQYINTLERT